MLVNSVNVLNDARREGYAVPQFNINNLEWTRYILEVCQEMQSPVILGVSEGAANYMGGYKTVYNIATGLISDLGITVPVVLHLDHGKSYEACRQAIDNGFTSVMIDASSNPIDENIRLTKEVVIYAHSRNVTVEAEVGHVGGTEENIVNKLAYANINECIKLTNEAVIDSLAPAIGNAHGQYQIKSNIDLQLLNQIKLSVSKPLVLHGGTGITDEQVVQAIKNGIAKININTELQVAWSKAIREFIKSDEETYDPRKIISSGKEALMQVVRSKITLFMSNNKAK